MVETRQPNSRLRLRDIKILEVSTVVDTVAARTTGNQGPIAQEVVARTRGGIILQSATKDGVSSQAK